MTHGNIRERVLVTPRDAIRSGWINDSNLLADDPRLAVQVAVARLLVRGHRGARLFINPAVDGSWEAVRVHGVESWISGRWEMTDGEACVEAAHAMALAARVDPSQHTAAGVDPSRLF